MPETDVERTRCRDTGVVHYLRDQGKPWARYVPVMGNPFCDCERGESTQASTNDELT